MLFGFSLLCLCTEGVIFAGQAENYAITILGSVLILFLFSKSKDSFWKWNWGFLTLFCYAQWQFFYIVFVFYAVFFINSFLHKNKEEIKNILLSGETTLLLNIPNLFFFFKRGMLNRGVQFWNVGPNMEYLFRPYLHKQSIVDLCLYTFNFVFGNIIKIYKYLFVNSEHLGVLFSTVLAVFLMTLSILGIIKLHKKYEIFAFFIDGLIFTVALLVIKRKLTLSPSRHMLIYQPFIVMCIVYGLFSIFELMSKKIIASVFLFLFAIYSVLSIVSVSRNMKIWKNNYSEKVVYNAIQKYNPDVIVTIGTIPTMNLFLSKIPDYKKCKGDIYKSYIIKSSLDSRERLTVMGYNTLLEGEHAEKICEGMVQEIFGIECVNEKYKSKLIISDNSFPGGINIYEFYIADELNR